jgi:hypothetical protein
MVQKIDLKTADIDGLNLARLQCPDSRQSFVTSAK